MSQCEERQDPFIEICRVVIKASVDIIDLELEADRRRRVAEIGTADRLIYGTIAAGARAFAGAGSACRDKGGPFS